MTNSTEPSTPDSGNLTAGASDEHDASRSARKNSRSSKPRLTVEQKNDNHKEAENKRRNAIREHFTQLSHLVPGAENQERSEQVMLSKTASFLRDSIEEIRALEAEAQIRGISTSDVGRLSETDYGGAAWQQVNMAKYEAQKAKKTGKGHHENGQDNDAEGEDDIGA